MRSVELDGIRYRVQNQGKHSDNSCIMQDYLEPPKKKGEKAVRTRAYARIVDIFEHRMYPHRESPARVIIECEWYEEVGINPVNGLQMIRLNENWEVARYAFLDTCVAADVVYWPTDPFDAECETMDVIRH